MRWLVRRLGWGLLVLAFVLTATFALAQVIPADPARAAAGPHASAQSLARIRANLCLDRPLLVQYGCFVGRIARGDLGRSFSTGQPVAALLRRRAGPTLQLALAAVALQILLGLPLGILAATRRRRPIDHVVQTAASLAQATPVVFLGPFLLWLLAYRIPLFPVTGHLFLPALTLAIGGAAWLMLTTRAEMLAALDHASIRTARAKGVPEHAVALRHALPQAAAPIITLVGLELGALAGGAVFVEDIFGWPGLGREAVNAIVALDLPVVLGIVLVAATAVVLVNLVVDIVYVLVDPRVRP